jgi:4-hydroxybenzoate polyprenyltransferase
MSTGAVVISAAPPRFVVPALLASVAFMLHLRIADDYRDFAHDRLHHPERPLPSGAITIRDLAPVDLIAVAIFVICGLFAGAEAAAIAFLMIAFSYFASRDFLLGQRIRRHFFAYNLINMLQMGFLQILIYHFASSHVRPTRAIVLHFLFTFAGSLIVELLRKIKVPGQDGTGRDTYTSRLGFRTALGAYAVLLALQLVIFLVLSLELAAPYPAVLTATAAALSLLSILYNDQRRSDLSNRGMQVCFLAAYGCLNTDLFLGTWR